jgi:AcrR family transcriptional regulator
MKKPASAARIPRQSRSIETKRRIIEMALELFAEKGFHHTNSKEIANRAGVAIGSFYAYFPDKKVLFLETLAAYVEAIAARITPLALDASTAHEARQSVINYVNGLVEAHLYYPKFHREALILRHTDAEVKRIMDEQEKREMTLALRYIAATSPARTPRDMKAVMFVVYNAIQSTVHAIVFGETKIASSELVMELAKMITGYLLPGMGKCS